MSRKVIAPEPEFDPSALDAIGEALAAIGDVLEPHLPVSEVPDLKVEPGFDPDTMTQERLVKATLMYCADSLEAYAVDAAAEAAVFGPEYRELTLYWKAREQGLRAASDEYRRRADNAVDVLNSSMFLEIAEEACAEEED